LESEKSKDQKNFFTSKALLRDELIHSLIRRTGGRESAGIINTYFTCV